MCYCDEEGYFISLLTLNIVNCICLIIYLNFQTYVSRPIIVHEYLFYNTNYLREFIENKSNNDKIEAFK